MISDTRITVGLEHCLVDPPLVLEKSRRFALLANQASVDAEFKLACDCLAERFPHRLSAIFTPQHGLWCEQQANMILSPHTRYDRLDVPVYSLYSETLAPTTEMLAGIDCLVIDLQDVGTRVYTFAATAINCIRACAQAGIPVVVLDRPNPLGGEIIEGPVLDPGFRSFVGYASLPMRHGLTFAELVLHLNRVLGIQADLAVVPMQGWRRDMFWSDTGRIWIAPSPNMPTPITALLYPGQVLLEGTTLSEGRGTTRPFELMGAPFIEADRLLSAVDDHEFPGVRLVATHFLPTFDKWSDRTCSGVSQYVLCQQKVRSFRTTVVLLQTLARLYPQTEICIPPPYEFETEKMPLDILYGNSSLRLALQGQSVDGDLFGAEVEPWSNETRPDLLY